MALTLTGAFDGKSGLFYGHWRSIQRVSTIGSQQFYGHTVFLPSMTKLPVGARNFKDK